MVRCDNDAVCDQRRTIGSLGPRTYIATSVAKSVVAFAAAFWIGVRRTWKMANGGASVLASRDGTAFAPMTVSATSQGIDHIMWAMNFAKATRISTARSA